LENQQKLTRLQSEIVRAQGKDWLE
jgi:hypothetical protein